MDLKRALLMPVKLLAVVVILTGCVGTSLKPDVSNLRTVTGASLPGAMGKTVTDQDRIDDTVAGLCAADVFNADECAIHTVASDQRRGELR